SAFSTFPTQDAQFMPSMVRSSCFNGTPYPASRIAFTTEGILALSVTTISARSVARLTETLATPGTVAAAFSTDATQDAQFIPSTSIEKLAAPTWFGLLISNPLALPRARIVELQIKIDLPTMGRSSRF